MKQEQLEKVRGNLPRGAQKRVADRLGIKTHNVYDFLNGKSSNVDIHIELIKEVRDHVDKLKELNSLLDQIEKAL